MNLLKRIAVVPAAMFALLTFNGCEEDFNTIGGEIIGGEFDALPLYNAGVTAYSKNIGPVQTNGLPANLLGVYKEPVYGLHTASVLSQVSLPQANNDPTFGTEPRLDSVILTLPYYSKSLEPDSDGNAVYQLDSVYGNAPFKLSVNRSNLFINEFDPNEDFVNRQRYYSDLGPVIETSFIGEPLYTNESFIPSPKEVVYFEEDPTIQGGGLDTVRVSPRLRVPLSNEFFKQNIIDKEGSSELSNNNNFRNFIRGLYFKAEPLNEDGSMMLLKFDNPESGIVLYYTNFEPSADSIVEVQNSFRIELGPNTINTFNQELPATIAQDVEESNEFTGAENLYLKGGAGSLAVIELFENEEELEDLKAKDWLINEANLVFYVNQDIVEGGEPERIYLYNIETNQPLIDYFIEAPDTNFPLNSLRNHSGRLVRDEDENGVSYKMKITEHVKNILSGATENTKLGLVVTQDINLTSNSALKAPIDSISRVPTASVITPRGTVLYGNLATDPDKKLKFNIYYTETNN